MVKYCNGLSRDGDGVTIPGGVGAVVWLYGGVWSEVFSNLTDSNLARGERAEFSHRLAGTLIVADDISWSECCRHSEAKGSPGAREQHLLCRAPVTSCRALYSCTTWNVSSSLGWGRASELFVCGLPRLGRV